MNASVGIPSEANPRDCGSDFVQAISGVLVGTAVGDSLGLPMEGLCARRQARLFPMPLRQRLVGRAGMISDDTEHTAMLAQSLLTHPADVDAFQRDFARRLRWWLVSLPAGVGFATLRAILKLWVGVSPDRSGVWSAGNGPAMRAALLGVYFANEPEQRRRYVRASTQITHRDPRAEIAATAVVETAAWMSGPSNDVATLMQTLECLSDDCEWSGVVAKLREAVLRDESTQAFAQAIGVKGGVSGYAFQTVPIAIYAAIRNRDRFEQALTEVIACGGDTDTVGAITGALVGARVGVAGIPEEWRLQIIDWPRSVSLLQRIADKLAAQRDSTRALGGVSYFWPAIPIRNLIFLGIVLCHGFRRLLPPY